MVAGFSIDPLGHLPTFLLLSTFTLIPLLLLWFRSGFLPLAGKQEVANGKQNAFDLWHIPVLRNIIIASGIISSAWDLFQFYMPVYGYAVGLSASAIGAVLGVFALATFVIRIFLPRLIKFIFKMYTFQYIPISHPPASVPPSSRHFSRSSSVISPLAMTGVKTLLNL
jgi:cyanate permease